MQNQQKQIVLICDIGGTNVRFGLYTEGEGEKVNFDAKYKCDQFTSFEQAVSYYLSTQNKQPTLCVIGAAGNIDEYNGEVLTTNTPWKASAPKLKAQFPFFRHIRLVNDFALQGWALGELTPEQYRPIFRKENSSDFSQGQVVIIGPGTGLGTCLILQNGKHPQTIYTSEAGHSTLPYIEFSNEVDNEDNRKLLRILNEHYAQRGTKPVMEHIVSGTGITNVYHAFRDGFIPTQKSQRVSSEEIETLANRGDVIALKTFKFFNAYLGAHTGSMASTTKAQNVFFCGGLMSSPYVLHLLEESEDFKQQFINRAGMTDAMKNVQFSASCYRDMATLGLVVRSKHLIETTKSEEEKKQANYDIVMSLAIMQAFIETNCPEVRPYMKKVERAIERFKDAQTKEIHPKKIKTKRRKTKKRSQGRSRQ